MKRELLQIITALAVSLCITVMASADVKMKVRSTYDNRSFDGIISIKGKRQRKDWISTSKKGGISALSVIEQCDTRQSIIIDNTNKRYSVSNILKDAQLSNEFLAFGGWQLYWTQYQRPDTGGIVTVTTTLTDTGERREMFGFTARHIKTSITWEAAPAKCDKDKLLEESDGWYVDLLYGIDCSPDISGTLHEGLSPLAGMAGKCSAYYNKHHYNFRFKQIGAARLGFPLLVTTKTYDDRPTVSKQEVLELTTMELDAALFGEPANYTHVFPLVQTKKRR